MANVTRYTDSGPVPSRKLEGGDTYAILSWSEATPPRWIVQCVIIGATSGKAALTVAVRDLPQLAGQKIAAARFDTVAKAAIDPPPEAPPAKVTLDPLPADDADAGKS